MALRRITWHFCCDPTRSVCFGGRSKTHNDSRLALSQREGLTLSDVLAVRGATEPVTPNERMQWWMRPGLGSAAKSPSESAMLRR